MEIILRRHGKTSGNLCRYYNGSTDDPLCAEGIREAMEFEADLEQDCIWVSPLLRTQQTAKILYPNAKQHICQGLQEMDFGVFEGKSSADMVNFAPYISWLESNCEDKCPQGEKKSEFVDRCAKAFRVAIDKIGDAPKAVFVLHGGVLMAILSVYLVPKRGYFDFETPNCCGFNLDFDYNDYIKTGELVLENCRPLGMGELPKW